MTALLLYPLKALGAMWLLWVFFLAVMRLQQVRDAGKMTRVGYILGMTVLYPGWALDIFCNLILMTALLFEIPKEFTVTARLKRHAAGPEGWRKKVALWFGANLLDAYDPSGKHL